MENKPSNNSPSRVLGRDEQSVMFLEPGFSLALTESDRLITPSNPEIDPFLPGQNPNTTHPSMWNNPIPLPPRGSDKGKGKSAHLSSPSSTDSDSSFSFDCPIPIFKTQARRNNTLSIGGKCKNSSSSEEFRSAPSEFSLGHLSSLSIMDTPPKKKTKGDLD